MEVTDHLRKLNRTMSTLDRLDQDADSEAYFEFAMVIGTHWLNIGLHRLGVTGTDLAEDMWHSDKPVPWYEIPPQLQPAFKVMKQIEDERNRFVRGPEPCRRADVKWCLEQLDVVRSSAGDGQ